MKFAYTAIFEPEDGLYNVTFPDLPHCYTCGDDLADALYMAQDVLSGYIANAEEENAPLPAATPFDQIAVPGGCIAIPVLADVDAWRRVNSTKSVKKTLTIPQWLDTAAQSRNVNFSQVLQDALRAQLQL